MFPNLNSFQGGYHLVIDGSLGKENNLMDEKIPRSLFEPMRSKIPINLLERIRREAGKLENKHLDREDWEEAANLVSDVLYYMSICRPGQAKGDLGFLRAMLKEIRRQASHVKEEGKGRNCAEQEKDVTSKGEGSS